MTEPTRILLVNPDDPINIADAKAIAAEYGAEVRTQSSVPHGKILMLNPQALKYEWPSRIQLRH
jgi:hypothetical protein